MNKESISRMSPEAAAVLDKLNEETKRIVQKANPFRSERNAAILYGFWQQ